MFATPARRLRIAAVIVPVAAVLAACGSTGGGGGATPSASVPSASPDSAAAAKVPSSIRTKGTLLVASDATYPPDESVASDGHTVIGMGPDLIKAIGTVLNLSVDVMNVTFNDIIPGLQSGKYDIGDSSFSVSAAREQVVDFVTYYTSGTTFMVKASGGPNIQSLSDLCGKNVGVESATTEQTDAQTQSQKCTSSGKAAVNIQVFPDQNSDNLALSSGRVDVDMLDTQVASYQVKLNPQFKLSGQPYGVGPYGFAIPKSTGPAGMDQAVQAAMKDLISSGVYKAILDKWGIPQGAITSPEINPPAS
jgi:polar amino acid transport system substrate-binding protein